MQTTSIHVQRICACIDVDTVLYFLFLFFFFFLKKKFQVLSSLNGVETILDSLVFTLNEMKMCVCGLERKNIKKADGLPSEKIIGRVIECVCVCGKSVDLN